MPLYNRTGVTVGPSPVLVVAMEGWIDAGLAAQTAWGALSDAIETELVASFDAEELIDFRARRPHLRIVDGINCGLTWLQPELRGGVDDDGAALLFLVGPEPDFRWQGFASAVSELALELGCRLMVGLGGFPATVPHTRPIRLAATASNSELAEQVGFVGGELEVPAGVQAVLERTCSDAGIPSVGLWARVPHYLSATAFPAAALALVEGLETVSGIHVDTFSLQEAAELARQKVDQLIAQSGEHATLIRTLEEQIDEVEGTSLGSLEDSGGRLPSGDELAAELELFLRRDDGLPPES
jgi:predicted ATP-grasp superfamily ATP-dependent carboligase